MLKIRNNLLKYLCIKCCLTFLQFSITLFHQALAKIFIAINGNGSGYESFVDRELNIRKTSLLRSRNTKLFFTTLLTLGPSVLAFEAFFKVHRIRPEYCHLIVNAVFCLGVLKRFFKFTVFVQNIAISSIDTFNRFFD